MPPKKAKLAAEVYTPPAEGTKSLIIDVTASRDERGRVWVQGKALLPHKTSLGIHVFREKSRKAKDLVAETQTFVGFQGVFSGGPYDIPKAGKYDVEVTSYFNGVWQPPDIRAQVGEDGKRLPRSAIVPNDREFPQQGGYVDYIASVKLSPLPRREQAIEAVKRSKLYVQGKGQAVDTVAQIVKFMNSPGMGFRPGEWSASDLGSGNWKVSLQHWWGKESKVANWEYDERSGKVRYLDPDAKMLSWIPAE